MSDFIEMRAVGVQPQFVQKLRREGITWRNTDQLVELQAMGLSVSDLKRAPAPPRPPRPPRVPPPGWDPLKDPNPDPGG